MRSARGFTILELLIALAVFAIMSAMAYGGLNTVLKTRQETDRQSARLSELQTAMTLLSRDLNQLTHRPIRDEYGDVQPALRGGGLAPLPLELTRAGWRNPAQQQRSTLQRVGYGIEDGALVRYGWRVLDRAQDSAAYPQRVLTRVTDFKVRFLNTEGEWIDAWPPDVAVGPSLRAVEVSLQLEDLGVLTRLFRVPGG